MATPKPKFTDSPTAALIGRVVILEEIVAALLERADQQEFRARQMEERLARVTSRSQLMSERDLANLLQVSVQTLKNWREEKPRPRIQFILTEGGSIRYKVEAVETYLESRERGKPKAALKAA